MTRRTRLSISALGLALVLLSTVLIFALQPAPLAPVAPPPAPVTAQPEPAPPETPTQPATPDLVLDLFAPSPDTLDAQQRTTQLRNQIEEALAISMLLTRCNLLSTTDYADTYNALIHYAVASGLSSDYNAASVELAPLAASAGASYALVYSRVPCTDASLPAALASLRHWQAQSARAITESSITP